MVDGLARLVPEGRQPGFSVAKAALRLVGFADLADVITDLAGAGGRKSVHRFVDEAVRQVAGHGSEFRELESADLEPAKDLLLEVLDNQVDRALGSRIQRRSFLRAALIGGSALHQFLSDSEPLPWQRREELGEACGYFDELFWTACDAIARYVQQNSAMLAEAKMAALGIALEDLDDLRRTTSELHDTAKATASRLGVSLPIHAVLEYRDVICEIAPSELLGRGDECRLSAEFAAADRSRWLGWSGALKSGKTGLMATIVKRGIPGVDIVPFFVIRNQYGMNDRSAFLSRTLPFLAQLSEQPQVPVPTDPVNGTTLFIDYLRSSGAAVLRRGRRLLLLIDGLDEDPALGAKDSPSIASLLPSSLPEGVNVMVAARPHPPLPNDVPIDHPLRDRTIWQHLRASAHADEAVDPSDVRDLMSTRLGFDVAGFLAAAGGPLTAANLVELNNTRLPAIEQLLHQRVGRTLITVPLFPSGTGYRLGHDTIDVQVVETIDTSLADYPIHPNSPEWQSARRSALAEHRKRIHTWAGAYSKRRWPERTPAYLLGETYPLSMVANSDRDAAAVRILTDQHRIHRLFEMHDSHYPAARQLFTVAEYMFQQRGTRVDLYMLGRILLSYDHLRLQLGQIPSALPAVHAQLGQSNLALNLAHSISATWSRDKALDRVAKALATAGRPDEALAAAEGITANRSRAETLSRVLIAFDATRQHGRASVVADQALTAANAVAAGWPRAEALSHVAVALATVGELDRARATVEAIAVDRHRISVFCQLAVALASDGQHEQASRTASQALAIAKTIIDGRYRGESLSHVATALAAAGLYEQARTTADEALDVAETIAGDWPRARALSQVATALAATGQHDQAGTIADQVSTIAVAAVTEWASEHHEIYRADVESGEWDRRHTALYHMATALASAGQYDQARSIAQAISVPSLLRIEALTQIAKSLATNGNADQARATAEAITGGQHIDPDRVGALSEIAVALAATGRDEQAHSAADQALAIAEAITDDGYRAEALSHAAAALAATGQRKQALTAALQARSTAEKVIDSPWDRYSALTEVATALAGDGQPDQARATAELINRDMYRADALSKVAVALFTTGKYEEAGSVAYQGLAIAETMAHDWQRASALSHAVTVLTTIGQFDDAQAAAETIDDDDYRVGALQHVAMALAGAGKHAQARAVAGQALAAAEAIIQSDDREKALSQVTAALATTGQVNQARTTAGAIWNSTDRSKAWSDMAIALVSAGEPGLARTAAEAVTGNLAQVRLLLNLATAFSTNGQQDEWQATSDQALTVAMAIGYDEHRAEALSQVARTFATAGEHDKARSVADQAFGFAEKVSNNQHRAQALSHVSRALAAAGQNDKARTAACRARAATETIGDYWTRYHALREVIPALALTGQPEEARAAAEEMTHDRVGALSSLVDVLARTGHLNEAEAAAEEITNDFYRAIAFSRVADALARAGDRAPATSQLAKAWLLRGSPTSDWKIFASIDLTASRRLGPYISKPL